MNYVWYVAPHIYSMMYVQFFFLLIFFFLYQYQFQYKESLKVCTVIYIGTMKLQGTFVYNIIIIIHSLELKLLTFKIWTKNVIILV